MSPEQIEADGMEVLSETVQTVQGAPAAPEAPAAASDARKPWIEIAQDDGRQWHWMLWTGNGRQIATNAIPYPTRHECLSAAWAAKDSFAQVKTVAMDRTEPPG